MRKTWIFLLTRFSYYDTFCSRMNIVNNAKVATLQCAFPKLTEANQQYVLGVAEGLKYAQSKPGEIPEKKPPQDSGQRRGTGGSL
jgi:hypothetical protein